MGMYKRNSQMTQEAGTAVADAPRDVADILTEMDGRLAQLFDLVRLAIDTEKVEPVGGWILGRRSKDGQRCIWLYPPRDTGLRWVLTTIWIERFGELPFDVPADTPQWPSASAPTKDEAYQSGAITECDFSIVMKHTGEFADTGKPVFKFDRILRDDDEVAVSVPRPRETPAMPSADEAQVLRVAAVTATSARDAATAVYQLVPGGFKSPTSAEKFLLAVVGNMPWHGGAALVAAQAYAASTAAGMRGSAPVDAATAVYAHAAGAMG